MNGGTHSPSLFPVEPEREVVATRHSARAFASVAVNRPMRCEYTYGIPEEFVEQVVAGTRVVVPFAGKREVAVVVGVERETELAAGRIKNITQVLDPEPIVSDDLLSLTRWIASYYACSWGEALAAVLPAALKREGERRKLRMIGIEDGVAADQLVELEERHPKQYRLLRTLSELGADVEMRPLLRRLNLSDSPAQTLLRKGLIHIAHVDATSDELVGAPPAERQRPEKLTPEQAQAVATIRVGIESNEYHSYLVHGVTGSGKTEVYLLAIEQALARGRGAIVLVPEIALTPQTVGWFRARFGAVAVLHSRMSDVQRLEMWEQVRRGKSRVVVGARSAVFAPVPDLGVIVVDEEHEPSFKQGSTPRYHGRDVAVMRARKTGAVCILGSATPALESWHNAKNGRYELIELKKRVHGGEMPPIEIVDMRQEKREGKEPLLFSRRLRQLLTEAYARREQSILFLNRRGFAPVLWCAECEETVKCGQCSVTLTFHRRIHRAVCHSCCEEIKPPKACPSCTAPALRYFGLGSERVEAALAALLPEASVRRMDSDTMLRHEDYETTLSAFGRGEIDVLVGTQMIAKGLDFPRVTVVGVIAADSSLHIPDFRSSERTFQLLSQVAGRAGRGDLPGHIIAQTSNATHPAIVHAARHDYEAFAAYEASERADLGYPPYGRLIRIVLEGEEEERTLATARTIHDDLRAAAPELQVLGPVAAPIALLRNRYRFNLLLKAQGEQRFGSVRGLLMAHARDGQRVRVKIDVDPVAML